MAAFLMPRVAFAPAYCAPSRGHHCRSFAPAPRFSLDPLLSLVDETLNQIQREARRQTRQPRPFNARFDIREHGEQYLVQGEVAGFEQENIDIEVSDEHTLKISGSTDRKVQAHSPSQLEPERMETEQSVSDTTKPTEPAADSHSETSSVKSYQATVEDDFEDLGAESETVASASSSSKGKEKATEEPKSQEPAAPSPQPAEAPVRSAEQADGSSWLSERSHGSFTRTFRFPVRIDSANVRASLKNGVLTVSVPKAPAPQVKRILIQ